MDNKIIVLIVAAIAAVGLIAGFALLGGGGAPPDGKEFVGEWKAYYAMGYNEEGVHFVEDDPALLDDYDFEVKMASDNLFTATSNTGAFEGTYNMNLMTAIIDNGPSTTTLKATLYTDTLIVNKLVYNGAGAMSIVDVICNHDGISPPADDREPSDSITIPDTFVLSSGVSFNGKSTDLSGDNLKITAQDGPLMKGTMDQQVGTETVVKDFLATMIPMPEEPTSVIVYRAIDEGGICWMMTYSIADKVLTATMADKSEIYAGTAAAYRIYTLPGAEKAPVPEGADYVGKTWKADTVDRIENGKVVKSDFPMVLNITSQNGILISGTITFGDGEILDYSAVTGPYGWTYVDCKIPGSEATGSVMLSPDEKTLAVRGIYGEATLEGTHGWRASSYTLKLVEPMPANALLGEWQCQYAQTVDGDGAFETETRSDGALQKWDLNIQSVKGGMCLGTFDGTSFVGSAPSAYIKSQVSPNETLVASVDGDGNLQAHLMTLNDDGTRSISNLVYTRGTSTTETASTTDIKGDYSVLVAEAYDGETVSKLGGTALNITEQQGTLFKGTMEIYDGGLKTVGVIGYITSAGDTCVGSMFIGPNLASVVFYDGAIFMNGPTPLGDVFSCVYVPVGDERELPKLEVVKGTWKNGESNMYAVNGDFAPVPGDAYDMKIIDDQGAFVSGTLGTISFLGIKVLETNGSMSLRLYPTDGTGGPYPIYVNLYDGGGIRVSVVPGMVYVTLIEESEK